MKIFEEKGYKYQKHLSTGGEGEIHLIKNVDKLFVAKIFDKFDQSSFDVINNLKELSIPNIPQIYEVFNHEDKTIIIRDYIEGITLFEEMKQSGPFDYTKSKAVILKICETLKALHNIKPNPIIYRDLKPENIIITPSQDVKIIDFGIARYHKKEATRDTVLAGTKGYTAPEVLAGMQSDNRSDIYSVGLLFYEMLTGKNLLMPPFQIRPVAESNPKLEKWLDVVIEKATDFNQTNRYASIEEFVFDLDHTHKVKNPKKRKSFAIAVAIATVVLIGGGLAYLLLNTNTPVEQAEPTTEIIENVEQAGYTSLLELDFDDAEDEGYVWAFDDLGSKYEISDSNLNVLEQVCEIDFLVENGMTVHYKVMGSKVATVGLGPYNVTAYSRFESSYYNNVDSTDYAVWDLKMQGAPIKGESQYIDILLYTNEENTAVYAIVFDESENAAYTAYKIPEIYDDYLYLSVCNSQYSGNDFINLDYVDVIEGSIKEYMADNFKGYMQNKENIDRLLDANTDTLKELPIEKIDY